MTYVQHGYFGIHLCPSMTISSIGKMLEEDGQIHIVFTELMNAVIYQQRIRDEFNFEFNRACTEAKMILFSYEEKKSYQLHLLIQKIANLFERNYRAAYPNEKNQLTIQRMLEIRKILISFFSLFDVNIHLQKEKSFAFRYLKSKEFTK